LATSGKRHLGLTVFPYRLLMERMICIKFPEASRRKKPMHGDASASLRVLREMREARSAFAIFTQRSCASLGSC